MYILIPFYIIFVWALCYINIHLWWHLFDQSSETIISNQEDPFIKSLLLSIVVTGIYCFCFMLFESYLIALMLPVFLTAFSVCFRLLSNNNVRVRSSKFFQFVAYGVSVFIFFCLAFIIKLI